MKTIPIITFFLCTVMYAHAQLNIVPKNDGLKEYTVTNAHPYDSLTNVEKRSFTSLPGQTLYMHGVKMTGTATGMLSTRSISLPGMAEQCTRRSTSVPPLLKRWWGNITR